MFTFRKNNRNAQYILILPSDGSNFAEWELVEQEELDSRANQNLIPEGTRVFRVDEEIKVRFEKSTILE